MLEILDILFKEKLEIKRELIILSVEAREAGKAVTKGDLPVAVKFLHKEDKESLLKRWEILEKAGVKVTEELSDESLLDWYRLSKIQDNVRTKYPTVPTSLSFDKLIIEDKIISWDHKKSKLFSKAAHFLPRKDKNR